VGASFSLFLYTGRGQGRGIFSKHQSICASQKDPTLTLPSSSLSLRAEGRSTRGGDRGQYQVK
jgi:hypothetical protein